MWVRGGRICPSCCVMHWEKYLLRCVRWASVWTNMAGILCFHMGFSASTECWTVWWFRCRYRRHRQMDGRTWHPHKPRIFFLCKESPSILYVSYVKKVNQSHYKAWTGPEGSRKLRFPDFVTTAEDGGKFVSVTHRPHLPPGNAPGTTFLLEAESTPGP